MTLNSFHSVLLTLLGSLKKAIPWKTAKGILLFTPILALLFIYPPRVVLAAPPVIVAGLYETLRSTPVYSRPSEDSQRVTTIESGVEVLVVNVQGDWLEVRSGHGRGLGFIRRENARFVKAQFTATKVLAKSPTKEAPVVVEGKGLPAKRRRSSAIQSPDFSSYLEMIKRRVESAWRNPGGISGRRQVIVGFVLNRGGELVQAEVQDSTHSKLAQGVLEAVRRASPFPPIPESLKDLAGRPLRIKFEIDFGVKVTKRTGRPTGRKGKEVHRETDKEPASDVAHKVTKRTGQPTGRKGKEVHRETDKEPASDVADYVMLSKSGAKWVYNFEREVTVTKKLMGLRSKEHKKVNGTLTITNQGERSFEGRNTILFVWKFEQPRGNHSMNYYLATSPEGITLVGREFQSSRVFVTTRYNPPKLYGKNPLTIGTTWSFSGVAHSSGTKTSSKPFEETRSIVGREKVTVPAGQFEAIKLTDLHSRRTTSTEWWVKGVGLVKGVRPRTRFELVSYSIPADGPKVARPKEHGSSQQESLGRRLQRTKRHDLSKESRLSSGVVFRLDKCSTYGRRLRGNVPPEIDLSSDVTAKKILNQTFNFPLKECLVGYRYPIEIYLYQSNKLVVSAKATDYTSHKAGIYRDYRNIAKNEVMLARGHLLRLAKKHYLFLLGSDVETGTKFWRYSRDPSLKCWKWAAVQSDVIGEVPKTVSLLNDTIPRSLVLKAEKMSRSTCKGDMITKVRLVPFGYQVKLKGTSMSYHPLHVVGEVRRDYPSRRNPQITRYANHVFRAEQIRLQEKARAETWDKFVQKYGVHKITSKKEVMVNMHVNPFAYQGKTVAIYANLKRMVSPDTGVFGDIDFNIIASSIPRNLFTSRNTVVLVGRVLGLKEGMPHLKFVGAHFCKAPRCSDFLPR